MIFNPSEKILQLQHRVISGSVIISDQEFPSFLYPATALQQANGKPQDGLLRSDLLLSLPLHLHFEEQCPRPEAKTTLQFDYTIFTDRLLTLFKNRDRPWVKNLPAWWEENVTLVRARKKAKAEPLDKDRPVNPYTLNIDAMLNEAEKELGESSSPLSQPENSASLTLRPSPPSRSPRYPADYPSFNYEPEQRNIAKMRYHNAPTDKARINMTNPRKLHGAHASNLVPAIQL
ncbi:hypothetical protein CPB83DRAFT_841018 [Crepidotus variabilis]|uniref:Uncharacterized protein n=1 Tax=Crepidotus variabilis TaxID=179855 RepID=A0A9P6E3C2_9AGAR|nr:hypothetical protein CPB83DRAFT_841018 [Crepidotus variabilis]